MLVFHTSILIVLLSIVLQTDKQKNRRKAVCSVSYLFDIVSLVTPFEILEFIHKSIVFDDTFFIRFCLKSITNVIIGNFLFVRGLNIFVSYLKDKVLALHVVLHGSRNTVLCHLKLLIV